MTRSVYLSCREMSEIYFNRGFSVNVTCGFIAAKTMEGNCQNLTLFLTEKWRYLPHFYSVKGLKGIDMSNIL